MDLLAGTRRSMLICALAALTLGVAAAPSTAGAASCAGRHATLVGGPGDNVLRSPQRDVIVAGGGDDKILGLGGSDIICAGEGNDVVTGGNGIDRVFGEGGNDLIGG